jgi:hypothetical protein
MRVRFNPSPALLPFPINNEKIMAAYSILVGFKGGKKETIIVDDPIPVKSAFKLEMSKGASSKFDSIEIVDTRSGRGKRWRNTKKDVVPEFAKKKAK